MSYILDALKKSDRQRKLGQVPDLRTEHAPMVYGEERSSRLALGVAVVVGVLLLNLVGWLWWVKPWRVPEQAEVGRAVLPLPAAHVGEGMSGRASAPAAPVVGAESGVAPVPVTLMGRAAPPADDEAAESARPTVAEPGVAFQAPAPSVGSGMDKTEEQEPPPALPPLLYAELPDQIRNVLPKIMVSLHYFSDQPAARLAIINDRDLHEGDMVADGLQLQEINEAGVILGFRGYRFQVDKF